MVEIYYSPQFAKCTGGLFLVKQKAERREHIFVGILMIPTQNSYPFRPLKGYWAFSIDYHYRIIFSFAKDQEVRFHDWQT